MERKISTVRRSTRVAAAVGAVLSLGLVACGADDDLNDDQPQPPAEDMTPATTVLTGDDPDDGLRDNDEDDDGVRDDDGNNDDGNNDDDDGNDDDGNDDDRDDG